MSQETLNTVLVGVAAVAGCVAVVASIWELVLAKKQAALRPELELFEMQLMGLREAGLSDEHVLSYEKAKVQRELDRERGVPLNSPPPPDMVLRFKLSNRGRVAATHVVGKLFIQSAHLQPPSMLLPTTSLGYGVSEETRDGYFVVRTQPLPTPLLPEDDPLVFDVAVSVRAAGMTSVRYEFGSAEGALQAKGEVRLEVPPT